MQSSRWRPAFGHRSLSPAALPLSTRPGAAVSSAPTSDASAPGLSRRPLAWRLAEDADCGDYTRYRLYYDSTPHAAVPAYLLVPKGISPSEKRPGILAAHGHGSGKADICGVYADDEQAVFAQELNYDYAQQAACRGYVVIAPDWAPFGERRPPEDWTRVGRDACNVVGMSYAYFGYSLQAHNIWDGMRAVDILAARPEVDAGRLAALGLSYGGTMTTHLAINDPRLKVAVISGYISTVRGDAITMRGKGNFCGAQHVPQLLQYGDIPEMAGLIAPKPLLVEAGRGDDCFAIEDAREGYDRLQAIYQAAGCPERLARNEFDGQHQWHGVAAWEWLERWL